MASLTHVCMWSGNGWKRITAQEAARLHPGGTVSAHSGLFMCELCGQYVLLTDSTIQVRHFRHSSAEKSKDCPERTFGSNYYYSYNAAEHELPLRIINLRNNDFGFEIGFIRVPVELLNKKMQIQISTGSYRKTNYMYSGERLNIDSITYLSVGTEPQKKYEIHINGCTNAIQQFWPSSVDGVDPSGTLFDSISRKKLVYDSDVVVGKTYYLLRMGRINGVDGKHISAKLISQKSVNYSIWYLYEVIANDFAEEAARFFLEYHCRLTEQAVALQTVWPVYTETPYLIKYNKNPVVVYLSGYAPTTRVFPEASVNKYQCKENTVLEIESNSRQQLISAGRSKAIQYTYFWKELLTETETQPKLVVSDLHGQVIESGEQQALPENNILQIRAAYDGTVVISKDRILEKRKFHANTAIEIDNISWGIELRVFVGLDCVRTISYPVIVKEKTGPDEQQFLKQLKAYGEPLINLPHTFGAAAGSLQQYPEIRLWLYQCIRAGKMSKRAYRELQSFVISSEKGKKHVD